MLWNRFSLGLFVFEQLSPNAGPDEEFLSITLLVFFLANRLERGIMRFLWQFYLQHNRGI